MSFAPGKGASDTISVFTRLPIVPRYSRARMSSMARSKTSIDQMREDVNKRSGMSLEGLVLTSHAPHPSQVPKKSI
jgi:hypothetical protein